MHLPHLKSSLLIAILKESFIPKTNSILIRGEKSAGHLQHEPYLGTVIVKGESSKGTNSTCFDRLKAK